MDCLFCEIANEKLDEDYVFKKSSMLFEDETVVAFMDIHPANPGHLLVLPKRHCEEFHDLTESEAAHLAEVLHRTVAAMRGAGLLDHGYHLLQNNGSNAGQEIPHAHLHVIPRSPDDDIRFRIPSEKAPLEKSLLDKMVDRIDAHWYEVSTANPAGTFVLLAERASGEEGYSYLCGFARTFAEAKRLADSERDWRGGKYTIHVFEARHFGDLRQGECLSHQPVHTSLGADYFREERDG